MMFKALSLFTLVGLAMGAAVPNPNPLTESLNKRAPSCSTGPSGYGFTADLNRCIRDFQADPKFGDFDCGGRHFFVGGDHWSSAADCLGGCTPCLRGAAEMGLNWVHCDQKAGINAKCWIGYCVPGEPCYDW